MVHNHEHEHGTGNYSRAFAIGMALNLGFVGVEATCGILAHSVALLAYAELLHFVPVPVVWQHSLWTFLLN